MLTRAIGIAIVGARTSRIQVGFGSWIRNTRTLTRAIGKAIAGATTSNVQVGFGSSIRNDSDARQDISPSMAIGHTMVFGPVPSEVECHDANQRPDHERDFK